MKTKYLCLGVLVCLVLGASFVAHPVNAQYTGWPPTGFWNDPPDPSIYDTVAFGLDGYAPPEWQCLWDFGDGTTSPDQCWNVQYKRYNQDGDYSVAVLATNELGETSWHGRTISVRTHDVAITRLAVPKSATTGQTRQITVYIRNSRYLENVQVELYKNDFVWIGTLIHEVPPRAGQRTTTFNFNYTFTAEDARIGKVTFRAMAFILNDGGDDWQVDNDLIAPPTRVSR